jgi:hypothetical protein
MHARWGGLGAGGELIAPTTGVKKFGASGRKGADTRDSAPRILVWPISSGGHLEAAVSAGLLVSRGVIETTI